MVEAPGSIMVDKTKDIDPEESREWLEALESVLYREGVDRGHYLIERLIDKARRSRKLWIPS